MNLVKSFSMCLALAFVCSVVVAQESECSKCPSSCSKCPSESTVSTSATQEKDCSNCPSSCSKCPSESAVATTANQEKACSECPVSIAMKNLPTMTYKVGDEATCCSKSAAELAKKHSKPMHYVVGKKTFESKEQAYTALVESTEKFVNNFVTPTKCEKSGKTSIAGASCGCSVDAGKKSELVKKAVSEVKMTYVVDGKKCNCPNEAKSLAAKSEEAKTTYVVAGKESCCNMEARLNFAKAKYAAAVKAIASTTEKKKETVTSS